jgi:hypothetical protein
MGRSGLDAATVRQLAVRASCCPETIEKVASGRPVRGLAGYRARQVLREAGILASDPIGSGSGGQPGRNLSGGGH